MATCFDRWEKDSFFLAAEEVQESADRLESIYRFWMKHASSPADADGGFSGEIRRELQMALATAKWQLEEFDRAVRSSDEACSAGEETRGRHGQFITAISQRILLVEVALKEANGGVGEPLSLVRLDEGERDELAVFLSSLAAPEKSDKTSIIGVEDLELRENLSGQRVEGVSYVLKSSGSSPESVSVKKADEQTFGHRRTASACADIGAWKISIDDAVYERPNLPPPKIPSFSSLTKLIESTSKVNESKNAFRKWRGVDSYHQEELSPLRKQQLSRGVNTCSEKSKSCLSSCAEESYDKELKGWIGSLHRQLQRSQYQIQYGRSFQMIVWTALVLMMIVLFAVRAV